MEEKSLFVNRINECNLFNKKEINTINDKKLIELFERCYLLGVLDSNS